MSYIKLREGRICPRIGAAGSGAARRTSQRWPRSPAAARASVLGIAVLLAVLAPLALWLRNSSLVRVEHVTVTGIDGPQAARDPRALTSPPALDMTTLDVREDALRGAVAAYPVVRSLRTETDFPHGLRIIVNAYEPVAALQLRRRR